jgi:hypothetical protein
MIASVTPAEFGKYIWVSIHGGIASFGLNGPNCKIEYPELLTTLIDLLMLLFFWMELLDAGFPIL